MLAWPESSAAARPPGRGGHRVRTTRWPRRAVSNVAGSDVCAVLGGVRLMGRRPGTSNRRRSGRRRPMRRPAGPRERATRDGVPACCLA